MSYKIINIVTFILLALAVVLISIYNWSIWLFFGIILVYVILMLSLSTNIQWNYFIKGFHKNNTLKKKIVAISFDDGPVPNTLAILDVLDKYQVKAAFFCIGKNIEANPKIFNEIIKRGHIVGNHTYSHTQKIGFLSKKRIIWEINECNAIAKKVGDVNMSLFRPPFGIINPKTKAALESTGHQVVGWSVRPYDAILNSPDYILKRITKNLKSGDLILLHDNKPQSIEILEQLLLFLRSNTFGTIRPDKLFDIDAYS